MTSFGRIPLIFQAGNDLQRIFDIFRLCDTHRHQKDQVGFHQIKPLNERLPFLRKAIQLHRVHTVINDVDALGAGNETAPPALPDGDVKPSRKLHPPGKYATGPMGIRDVHGNVSVGWSR